MLAAHRPIDFDNHYYEPDDCFSRYIEPAYASAAVRIVPDARGMARIYLGDRRLNYMAVSPSHWVAAPGAHRAWMEGRAARTESDASPIDLSSYPAFTAPDPRRALLAEQGLAAAVMLPTLAVCVEHELGDDPLAAAANIRAFNRFIAAEWPFADPQLIPVALLSLIDLDFAVAELERVLSAGARIVHLKPGPVRGRSPADPCFDPFWERIQEAGVPVVFHTGDTGYHELYGAHWGEPARSPTHRTSMFQSVVAGVDRAAFDTVAALVLHNLFGRFPRLRVAFLELGAAWLPYLVERFNKAFRAQGHRTTLGGTLTDHPVDILRNHVHVCPFPEEDPLDAIELIGAERVLFGSDFPHPEGLAEPTDFALKLGTAAPDVQALVMRDNARRLLGLPA